MNPIENLPANEFLPKALHKQIDEWREAVKRVGAIKRSAAEAAAQIKRTELEDAESLRAAVVAGKPLPEEEAPKLRARIADAERRIPVAQADVYRLADALAIALRPYRDEIAQRADETLTPALEAYETALSDAEQTIRAAHSRVVSSSSLVTVVKAIDSGSSISQVPAYLASPPAFDDARSSINNLREVAGLLAGAKPAPRFRRVRLDDGRAVSLTVDGIHSLPASTGRKVVEILDGYGPIPEKESAPVRTLPRVCV
ncbi:hypothetical protein [Streptomyces sp. NPDC001876]|uniref:hypothetical protein n=1 Tax=Streptomyces sp. NPDC001876 TaxID=3154402 RepID=UPI003319D79B